MAVQEDDATELQFPKGMSKNTLNYDTSHSNESCSCCNSILQMPYIQCAKCQYINVDNDLSYLNLCLRCFCKGREFDLHKNDHDYVVIKELSIFGETWSGGEELKLLDSVIDNGLGNWNDVSKHIKHKSKEDCKQHFVKYYIDQDPATSEPKDILSTSISQSITSVEGTDDPPRPLPGTSLFRDMAGYNAARGDFIVDYKDNAESVIQDVQLSLFDDEDEDNLGQELQVALLDIYRWELGERHFRKKVVREHGLINMVKAHSSLHHYKNLFPNLSEVLPKLHQIINFDDFSFLTEGLQCKEELGHQINRLKEYRSNGLKKQSQASIYEFMKSRRDKYSRIGQKFLFNQKFDNPATEGLNNTSLYSLMPVSLKRRSIPLDISGKVGFDSLSNSEKELSSQLRILPKNYLSFKSSMVSECLKSNGLTLTHARTLLKIDVNKVRKMFDFMVSEGYIYKAG